MYITYQIWLSRNSLVFEAKVIFVQQVLERAIYLIFEYYHLDTATIPLYAPESWDPHVAPIVIQRVLFIF